MNINISLFFSFERMRDNGVLFFFFSETRDLSKVIGPTPRIL